MGPTMKNVVVLLLWVVSNGSAVVDAFVTTPAGQTSTTCLQATPREKDVMATLNENLGSAVGRAADVFFSSSKVEAVNTSQQRKQQRQQQQQQDVKNEKKKNTSHQTNRPTQETTTTTSTNWITESLDSLASSHFAFNAGINIAKEREEEEEDDDTVDLSKQIRKSVGSWTKSATQESSRRSVSSQQLAWSTKSNRGTDGDRELEGRSSIVKYDDKVTRLSYMLISDLIFRFHDNAVDWFRHIAAKEEERAAFAARDPVSGSWIGAFGSQRRWQHDKTVAKQSALVKHQPSFFSQILSSMKVSLWHANSHGTVSMVDGMSRQQRMAMIEEQQEQDAKSEAREVYRLIASQQKRANNRRHRRRVQLHFEDDDQ